MKINELYLKTAFACMACDGDIANEEVDLIKDYVASSTLFDGLDVETILNGYIAQINEKGQKFLSEYIYNVASIEMTEQQELILAQIAVKMIEADNKIEYSEISFFKKIRAKLKVSDEKLLKIFKDETLFEKFPEVEPEDFLLPDIKILDDLEWNISFKNIDFNSL